MNKIVKTGLLSLSLTLVVACSSTQNNNIDYNDDVDTPDVLLQDAQGGDSEYGLDRNAAKHNQQNKPDMLEQSIERQSTHSANNQNGHSKSQATTTAKPSSQPKVVKQSKPTKPTKKAEKKPKKEPTKQESALEVDDPLLGEIDPK